LSVQLVIFGASGDLTARKLIPALLRNFADGSLPSPLQVVGVSRSQKTTEAWRSELVEWVPEGLEDAWAKLSPHLHWVQADASHPEEVQALRAQLDALAPSPAASTGRLFYLALAPQLFGPVVAALSSEGMLSCAPGDSVGWRRVIVEKPFGTDLASAQKLNAELLTHLREDQIFRIDHYLGKETVQNILSLRFQNAIFEPLWNRSHVESVEISVCETVAMEGRRGAYYDKAGALRDMLQNHLMQVLRAKRRSALRMGDLGEPRPRVYAVRRAGHLTFGTTLS
jgi:glucose-6-phosphate 1-dehydrogenase